MTGDTSKVIIYDMVNVNASFSASLQVEKTDVDSNLQGTTFLGRQQVPEVNLNILPIHLWERDWSSQFGHLSAPYTE